MPSASCFPAQSPPVQPSTTKRGKPESSLPSFQPVMATANTNFGTSCTAKARPKKTLKSTEPRAGQGFDALRYPAGSLRPLLSPTLHIYLQASVITDAEPRG
ncbi:hypothetical protein MY4038_007592 [Beauveria bassiana]